MAVFSSLKLKLVMYNDATDLVDINKDVAIISIPSDLGWNIEYWSFSIHKIFSGMIYI